MTHLLLNLHIYNFCLYLSRNTERESAPQSSSTSSTGPYEHPAEAVGDFSPPGSHFVAERRHSSEVSSKNSDDKNCPDEDDKSPTDADQQLVKDGQEESGAEDDTLSDELEGTTSGRSSGTTSDRSSGTTSDRSSRMSSLRPEQGTSRQSACSSDLISPSIEVISPRSERSTEYTEC
jgi:hypothetical protein